MSRCAFGDHPASGRTVEAVIAPISRLPENSYISYAFCEEDLYPGPLPPGRYNVVLHILDPEEELTLPADLFREFEHGQY